MNTDGSRFKTVRHVLRSVMLEEPEWLTYGNRHDPVRLPWMPFQAADFIAIMAECVAEANGFYFLDVGSGPGTKMLLASELFGLVPTGIEYDRKMAKVAAQENRGTVITGDALEQPSLLYNSSDIIWLYRPFRSIEKQDALEKRIWEAMRPGAILAGGAWENHPPDNWPIIVDDWEARRGAWMKI